MFTNKKIYTIEPKAYNEGSIDESKLIKNKIDIRFLTHLIFFPQFEFSTFECLNLQKLNPSIAEDFKKKEVEVIIGLTRGPNDFAFREADIAIQTNMLTLLQIIHACQLVQMHDIQHDVKYKLEKQGIFGKEDLENITHEQIQSVS